MSGGQIFGRRFATKATATSCVEIRCKNTTVLLRTAGISFPRNIVFGSPSIINYSELPRDFFIDVVLNS